MGRFNMWVTPKTNRPSFCLILKLSQALDGLFSVLSSPHGLRFLLNEGLLNVTTFRCCCLGFFLTWNPLFIFRYNSFWHGIHYLFSDINAVIATFHVLVNTYFLNFRLALLIVLRALVHLIYLVIFNNFLVFNFPFFNFEQ